jgi:hypothetical protein
LIATLTLTIIVEGVVVLAYCIWRRKPLLSLLITSVVANIVTQSILWVMLNTFYRYYLAALLICEVFIWLFESLLIYLPHKNQLTIKNAALLSLYMNSLSFGVGWFLPV